jgi:hypothetical protein
MALVLFYTRLYNKFKDKFDVYKKELNRFRVKIENMGENKKA